MRYSMAGLGSPPPVFLGVLSVDEVVCMYAHQLQHAFKYFDVGTFEYGNSYTKEHVSTKI